jgi:lysophospholipase L1-like esterase
MIMHRLLITAATVLISLALFPGASAAKRPARYYLALGDSLSQGMQPDRHGATRNTDQGYTDQLFAIERRRIPSLQLVKLGCGGESTSSMITGHGNDRNARLLHCDRKGGSQLTAAERFLRAHHGRGEVPLITIDIGANDVDGCVAATNLVQCLTTGEGSIKRDVPTILRRLKRAAPKGTTFADMTLYDPVLGGYFSTAPGAKTLAQASPVFLKQVNDILTSADAAAGFRTADVAGAFNSYDSTDTVPFGGQAIPVNVANVCSWTWVCTTPPSGPNIHANKNGYAVIAGAFAKVLGRPR